MPEKRTTPLAERFWTKVDKNGPVIRPELGPCWMWIGARQNGGYGYMGRGRRGEGHVRAPRASLEIHGRPAPDGLDILHHCDNPPCVRPDHLWTGTAEDNIQDARRKGRLVGAGKGAASHRARLTEGDVRSIRQRCDAGESVAIVARDHPSVGYMGVWCVARRKSWIHL